MGRSDGSRASSRTAAETADAWIAATAVLYDAPLIAHNANDYSRVPGLKVITEAS